MIGDTLIARVIFFRMEMVCLIKIRIVFIRDNVKMIEACCFGKVLTRFPFFHTESRAGLCVEKDSKVELCFDDFISIFEREFVKRTKFS